MATGTSYEGKTVNVGDQVSIMGAVVSITGSAPSTAAVVIQEQYGVKQFTAHANDLTSPQETTGFTAQNMIGDPIPVAERVTANGQVTAISGSGQSALLTVTLDHSLLSIVCSAGSCHTNSL